jgi:hypothetical protein
MWERGSVGNSPSGVCTGAAGSNLCVCVCVCVQDSMEIWYCVVTLGS